MKDADGYKSGSFMSAATVIPSRFDIFELDQDGAPTAHFGTFTSGTPKDVSRSHERAIALVDGLAANAEQGP